MKKGHGRRRRRGGRDREGLEHGGVAQQLACMHACTIDW
jgi:hypothetical protein